MKDMHYSGAKKTGALLIAIAIALVFVFLSSTSRLMKSENLACKQVCGIDMDSKGESCPHENNVPLESYAGFSAAVVLAGIGASMIISGRKYREENWESEKKLEQALEELNGDEKKVYGLIKEGRGAMFQSELIERTGFAKVKMSRTLDKMEGRGIIERRRRGMTNMVLIKGQ